jgi:hypothetical protein
LLLAVALSTAVNVQAATAIAIVNSIDTNGIGAALGKVTFKDTEKGLLITRIFRDSLPALTASISTRKARAHRLSRTTRRWPV